MQLHKYLSYATALVNPRIGGILGIRLFAAKVRELREAKFGPRTVASEKTGIPLPTLIDWEMGKREPGATSLGTLARGLGVPCEDLLELLLADDPPAPSEPAQTKKRGRPGKKFRQKKPKPF